MLTSKEVFMQIQKLTEDIIRLGICDMQKYPSKKSFADGIVEIGFSNAEHSICLKNIPYAEMYGELDDKKQYNFSS